MRYGVLSEGAALELRRDERPACTGLMVCRSADITEEQAD